MEITLNTKHMTKKCARAAVINDMSVQISGSSSS